MKFSRTSPHFVYINIFIFITPNLTYTLCKISATCHRIGYDILDDNRAEFSNKHSLHYLYRTWFTSWTPNCGHNGCISRIYRPCYALKATLNMKYSKELIGNWIKRIYLFRHDKLKYDYLWLIIFVRVVFYIKRIIIIMKQKSCLRIKILLTFRLVQFTRNDMYITLNSNKCFGYLNHHFGMENSKKKKNIAFWPQTVVNPIWTVFN